jgi:hypothetical protein
VAIVDEIPPRLERALCAQSVQAFLPCLSPNLTSSSHRPSPAPPAHWDLFCSVVDNFGDIGVCWRLARQLAAEHAISVRLWVDDLHSAERLVPSLDAGQASQRVDGVEIRAGKRHSRRGAGAGRGGSLRLPASGGLRRGHGAPPAEAGVDKSRVPQRRGLGGGLPRTAIAPPAAAPRGTLFLPGFRWADRRCPARGRLRGASGGVFRGGLPGLLGLPRAPGELCVSLFSYENAGLADLLDCWSRAEHPVTCLVPEGGCWPAWPRLSVSGTWRWAAAAPWCAVGAGAALRRTAPLRRAAVGLRPELRAGEDSFVRAQWAERPFVWHIYPRTRTPIW